MKQVWLSTLLALSACGYVDPALLGQVDALDPLSVDPADVAVKVIWPEDSPYGLSSSFLSLKAARADGAQVEGVFELAQSDNVFAIAADDYARFRALQKRIRTWEAEDPEGTKGSLSIASQPCLKGPVLGDPGSFDVNLRLRAGGEFLPLLRDVPVLEGVDHLTTEDIAPCQSHSFH